MVIRQLRTKCWGTFEKGRAREALDIWQCSNLAVKDKQINMPKGRQSFPGDKTTPAKVERAILGYQCSVYQEYSICEEK